MAHVFISYAHEDKKLVDKICLRLKQESITYWIDEEEIDGGERFNTKIAEAIKNATIFLLVFSLHTNNSKFVRKELTEAENQEKEIIPFLTCDPALIDTEFKLSFNSIQRIEASQNPEEKEMEKLIQAIKNRLPKLPPPLCHNNKEIKIQHIEANILHVSINNVIKKVPDNYEDLKKIMTENSVSCFEWENNVYDINSLNPDSFGYLIGNIKCNQLLTIQLLEAVGKKSKGIVGVFYNQSILYSGWQYEHRIIDEAKKILSSTFVSTVGTQLAELIAIDKVEEKELSGNKLKDYKEQCFQIMEYTIDFLSFALLSKLWDDAKTIELTPEEKKKVLERINTLFPLPIEKKIEILTGLIKIYEDNKIELPIPEIKENDSALLPQGKIYQSCIALKNLAKEKENILNRYEAETHLATFLIHFSFLADYRMISMKEMGYREIRTKPPQYLHQYIELGTSNKANSDETSKYRDKAVFTKAVLLYKHKDKEDQDDDCANLFPCSDCINLFPFIIDYHALSVNTGSKICFFSYRQIKSLQYTLGDNDNTIITLEKKNNHKDINEILKKHKKDTEEYNESMKDFNIDCVIDIFNEMQKSFTSKATNSNNP